MWDAAFGSRFSAEDAEHAYGGTHVLLRESGAVVAHGSVVPRRIRTGAHDWDAGYVEAVAVLPDRHGAGVGSRVMEEVAAVLREQHELGVLSTGRHSFYERLGWERWRGPSYVERGPDLVRTPEDDDGLMVLRFGRSAGLDLRQPISCPDRPGDVW